MTRTAIVSLLCTAVFAVVSSTGCTKPEAPKALPPAGMAGAPSTLGNHGAVGTAPKAATPNPHGGIPGTGLPGAAVAAAPASQPASATPNFPTIVPGSGGGNPTGTGHQEPVHVGTVLETMDAADYTYVRIKKANGKEEWAASTRTPVKVGAKVTIGESLVMHDFTSKTLGRTFPRIIFGSIK